MDPNSDSEEELSHASNLHDDDVDMLHGSGRLGAKGARARVKTIEAGGDTFSAGGEEDDRVSEILSLGGMMSAGNAERRKQHQPMHAHTLSAPTLSNPPNAALAAPVDLSTVQPPPDKSGWLYKRGNLNSSWKKRWFVLRYQTLKYYQKSGDSKPKGFIPLAAAIITPGTSEKMRRLFGFEISSHKYTRVFVIHADTEQEMNEWMDCLAKNIDYVNLVFEQGRLSRNPAAQQANLVTPITYAPEQKSRANTSHMLDLELGEEYLKSAGLLPRLSAWRREPARSGFEPSQAKMVHASALRSQNRLENASCFAPHNTSNMVAVGSGSTHAEDLEQGTIQLISIETRDTVSNLTQVSRFAEDLAEKVEDRSSRDASRKNTSDSMDDPTTSSSTSTIASMTWPCLGEASALEWRDDLLLMGSSGGVVALYSLPENLASTAGLQPAQILVHEKASTIPLATPGKHMYSSRIRQMALGQEKRQLLSISNQYFYLWDLHHGSLLTSEIGSSQSAPLFAIEWNPHSTGEREFVFGGEEGTLRLVDTRLLGGGSGSGTSNAADRPKSIPWFSPRAHAGSVLDISWSPLVPHWFASCGSDGTVKVFDIRFGTEPVRTFLGHTNSVTSVGWSKSHCEMLCSGGIDKTVRVWNMRVQPHYTVYTHSSNPVDDLTPPDFSAPIIHSSFSPTQPFQILAGSQSGELVALHMQKELIAQYVVQRSVPAARAGVEPAKSSVAAAEEKSNLPDGAQEAAPTVSMQRSPADEAQEREIYTLLYLRDYERGFRAVAGLAQKYWTQGQYPLANQLLKLTGSTLFPLAANEPSEKPPSQNTLKVFNSLLTDLCRFLPPKVVEVSQQDELTKQRIEFLGLRLMVADRIQQGQYLGILAMADKICKHLSTNVSPTSGVSPSNASSTLIALQDGSGAGSLDQFDAITLERMATTILPHDHLRGLEFCIRIAKTLKDAGNFSLFIGIARVIFNPTIYERMDDTSSAAGAYSYIKVLSPLAHTPIGSNPSGQGTMRDDSRNSESESESENSTNSVSSSGTGTGTTPSRKPSVDDRRPNLRGSVSTMAGSPTGGLSGGLLGSGSASSMSPGLSNIQTTNSRGSIMAGNETQHAQITLDRDLRNPKIVLSQLSLLREMFTLLANDESSSNEAASPTDASASSTGKKDAAAPVRFNPYLAKQAPAVAARISLETLGLPPLQSATAKEICRLYEEHKEPQKLLPSIVHIFYFHSLVLQKKYDLVFVSATKIGANSVLKSYQFASVLEGVMGEITTPKFIKFLEKLANKEGTTKPPPNAPIGWNLSKLSGASLTMMNILFNCEYIPAPLASILPKYLKEFHDDMKKTLTEIRNNPAYVPSTSYSSAKADCKAKVEGILTQMARIKSHSKLVGEPHCHEEVMQFQAMLKKFNTE